MWALQVTEKQISGMFSPLAVVEYPFEFSIPLRLAWCFGAFFSNLFSPRGINAVF